MVRRFFNNMETPDIESGGLVQIKESGDFLYLVTGVDELGQEKKFAIAKRELEKIYNRGSNIRLAQFLKIVVPGLVLAEHIFRGLKRPLCDGKDMDAADSKLAFSWKPEWDYWWNNADRFESRELQFREAPDGRVFVVIVSPNNKKSDFPSVDYWIERWSWVRQSVTLAKAPVDWENRYDKKLK